MSNIKYDLPIPRELKFVHIDYWSRPLFVDQNGNYFGCLNQLFPDGASFETIMEGFEGSKVTNEEISYFGREIDGDPMGSSISAKKIKLVKEFTINYDES